MKRERWWINSRRRRADPIFEGRLRFAEKPAGIYVTRKSTKVEFLEDHRHVLCKDCNKDLASRPSARMESHPAAEVAGSNPQPCSILVGDRAVNYGLTNTCFARTSSTSPP